MELRSWLLWVVAAAGAVVLLAADAQGQKIFTNTWAVHIPGGPAVADRVAQKHGFHNLGQVSFLLGLFVTSGHDLVVERVRAETLKPCSRNC
mgnify:CR=1 FL=1|jgi:hypothetical protein